MFDGWEVGFKVVGVAVVGSEVGFKVVGAAVVGSEVGSTVMPADLPDFPPALVDLSDFPPASPPEDLDLLDFAEVVGDRVGSFVGCEVGIKVVGAAVVGEEVGPVGAFVGWEVGSEEVGAKVVGEEDGSDVDLPDFPLTLGWRSRFCVRMNDSVSSSLSRSSMRTTDPVSTLLSAPPSPPFAYTTAINIPRRTADATAKRILFDFLFLLGSPDEGKSLNVGPIIEMNSACI